jgi:MFS family permease
MSKIAEKIDLKHVLAAAVTITVALEILGLLMILGAIVPHFIASSGLLTGITFDIELFLALIAISIGLLIIIVFAAFFIELDRKLQDKILTPQFRKMSRVASEAKALLFIFGLAVILFGSAVFYGYYLVWKYVIASYVVGALFLEVIFIAIPIILLSIITQLVLALVGRFAVRAEKLTGR